MAHVVSGLLRKAPFTKDGCGQGGDSKMYVIELSEMNKDYKTGEKQYTNYKAMFFAKTDAAVGYYDKAFSEGSFVVVSCDKLKVEQREYEGKTYITLGMENARLENSKYADDSQQPAQQPQQQRSPQQRPAPQPQQQAAGQNFTPNLDEGWDSDIPF